MPKRKISARDLMIEPKSAPVKKTWMPAAAGILILICGVIGLTRVIFLWRFNVTFGQEFFSLRVILLWFNTTFGQEFFSLPVVDFFSYPTAPADIAAIYAGYYTIKRRMWPLSLIGALCAVFGWWLPAIPAIILVILSRKEFE